MARAAPRPLGGLPLRRGDRLSAGPGDTARPRFLPLAGALLIVVAVIAYGVPLVGTGDPLWPLPADTDPDVVAIHWGGERTEVRRGDPRHAELRRTLNAALSSIEGIEYRYGLPADDFAALRLRGHALEASYATPARSRGAYAIGSFRRLFVSFDGEEFARGLVFVGEPTGYRAGPLRSTRLGDLRDVAERLRGP